MKIYGWLSNCATGECTQTKQLGKRGVRLDQQGTGTGIGLSIAKEIVAINKGKISFDTIKGAGLHIEITLPISYVQN